MTNKWWLAGLVILCAIAGGGKYPLALSDYSISEVVSRTVGGIVTAVEVGFTPYFVDFRHFKVYIDALLGMHLLILCLRRLSSSGWWLNASETS